MLAFIFIDFLVYKNFLKKKSCDVTSSQPNQFSFQSHPPPIKITRTSSKATRRLINSFTFFSTFSRRPRQLSGFVCCFVFVASIITVSASSGYDSIECDPHSSRARTGRARLIASIPCDLTKQSYCNLPGEFYPW